MKAMRDGYKAHIINEPETGIVDDGVGHESRGPPAARMPRPGSWPRTIEDGRQVDALRDSAYGTGQMLKAPAEAGRTPSVLPDIPERAIPDPAAIDSLVASRRDNSLLLWSRISEFDPLIFGSTGQLYQARCPLKIRRALQRAPMGPAYGL